MIKEIIQKWELNKSKLEDYFKTTEQKEYSGYKEILGKIIELILNDENDFDYKNYDANKITEIDDGDYQGTLVYLIPKNTYQPSIGDYLITYVYYGSCSGCDTLLGISEYEDKLPSENQVKEYMTLALHLIQKMKTYGQDED